MATFYSPVAILNHLQEFLPRLTDRFSSNATVTGEIVAGTPQVLKITDTGHGLSAGDQVVLIDGKIDNAITAVVDNGDGSLRFTTAEPHDLTENYTETVELAGFTDSGLNNEFTLFSVPSRNLFEIEYPTSPTLNGNEVLRELYELGINGLFTIDRIVNTDIYEIDLTDKPTFTPQIVPTLKRAKDFNISICVTADRASQLYEDAGSGKNWIYIIMGPSNVSKDRNLKSDAVMTVSAATEARPLNMNNFSLNVYFDTKNDIGGAVASQLAWQDIYQILLAVCSGIKFDDFGNTNYLTVLINHEPDTYTKTYYSHMYTFEYNYEITQDQQFLQKFIESHAFRDSVLSFNEQQEGSEIPLDET